MAYRVKEIFYTLQGEGAHAGRPACSVGSPAATSGPGGGGPAEAVCQFCDTDFVGTDGAAGPFRHAARTWLMRCLSWSAKLTTRPGFVVCTGGEPLLQLDEASRCPTCDADFSRGRDQRDPSAAPRASTGPASAPRPDRPSSPMGDELKLVFPQTGSPRPLRARFQHLSLQPMDGPDRQANTAWPWSIAWPIPQWRLSLQTHKFIGIP